MSDPGLQHLKVGLVSERVAALIPLCAFVRERLRTHSIESSGKLKLSPEQHWDFTAEDLKDLGEIGRGAYGSVNKMVHKPSNKIMAVKVIYLLKYVNIQMQIKA